tara:strand:+ start:624 stop:1535 length:912 start_codon:yes stop_codon:yes gene_type:complete
MQLRNNYYYFKSALTPKQCTKILEAGMTELTKKTSAYGEEAIKAQTADGKEKGGVDSKGNKTGSLAAANITKEKLIKKGIKESDGYVRDSSIAWLSEKWIYDLLHPYIHEANAKAGWSYEWNFSEACQFTKYQPGQFYGWHADGSSDWPATYKPTLKDKNGKWKICEFVYNENKTDFDYDKDTNGVLIPKVKITDVDCPVRKQLNFMGEEQPVSGFTDNAYYWGKVRKLSMTLNLTEPTDYTGGDLKFDFGPHAGRGRFKTCKEIRPRGSIIIFPSFLHHQVTPVTKGTRYSLVIWSLGKPFK